MPSARRQRDLRWKKTWLVAAILAIALVALAGCGGGGDATPAGGDGDADAVSSDTANQGADTGSAAATDEGAPVEGSLTFWLTPDIPAIKTWWDEHIAAFEEANPDADVEFTPLATDVQVSKPAAAFAASEEPDVLQFVAGEQLNRYVNSGKIAPLNDLVDLNGINQGTLKLFTDENGNVYGFPTHQFLLVMWYNKDLFAEHDIAVPQTWDELLGACQSLSADGVVPITLGNSGQDQFTTVFWYSLLLYQLAGPQLAYDATYGENGVTWTDEAFVEAASRLKELVDANCFPDGFAGLNYSQMGALFVRGDAAMNFMGTWFAAEIEGAEAPFDVGVFAPVDVPGASYSTASLDGLLGGATGLAATVRGIERNPELVAAYLESVVSSADDYAKANSQLSAAADPEPRGDPLQAGILELAGSVGEVAPVTDFVPIDFQDELGSNVQALTTGDLSPEEFAEAMAQAAERERPNLPPLGG